jgi:hypothetical protein
LNIVTKRAIIKVKRTKDIDLFSITVGEYSRYVVDKAHKSHKSDIYIEKYIDTIGDALSRFNNSSEYAIFFGSIFRMLPN